MSYGRQGIQLAPVAEDKSLSAEIEQRPLFAFYRLVESLINVCAPYKTSSFLGSVAEAVIGADAVQVAIRDLEEAHAKAHQTFLNFEEARPAHRVIEKNFIDLSGAEAALKAAEKNLQDVRNKNAQDIAAAEGEERRLLHITGIEYAHETNKAGDRMADQQTGVLRLQEERTAAEKRRSEVIKNINKKCCSCFTCCISNEIQEKSDIEAELASINEQIQKLLPSPETIKRELEEKAKADKEALDAAQKKVRNLKESAPERERKAEELVSEKRSNFNQLNSRISTIKDEDQAAINAPILAICVYFYQQILILKNLLDSKEYKSYKNLENPVSDYQTQLNHYWNWLYCSEFNDVTALVAFNLLKEKSLDSKLITVKSCLELIEKHLERIPGTKQATAPHRSLAPRFFRMHHQASALHRRSPPSRTMSMNMNGT